MAEVSQNGYTVISSSLLTKRHKLPGGVVLPLRRGNAGWVLQHFARRYQREVEPLTQWDCHAYNKRRIAGSHYWSNHASGTAIDLNATQHPYGRRNTFSQRELENLRRLLRDYDGVIRWGGDYRTTKDEMHFEIDKGMSAVNALARRLKDDPNTVNLKKAQPGKVNKDVLKVKKALKKRGYKGFVMNRIFGRGTKHAYSDWQKSLGYRGKDADGAPGRASLTALGFKVEG